MTPFPRLSEMRICRRCSYLYDTVDHRCRQACSWDRKGQEPWPNSDFNEHTCLCRCCVSEPLRSGSRWSVWFCDECKARVIALNKLVGFSAFSGGK